MKIFIYTLIALALALIVFNVTLLDFDNLFEGKSFAAAVGIVLSLCAVCALLILKISKNIEEKSRR